MTMQRNIWNDFTAARCYRLAIVFGAFSALTRLIPGRSDKAA